MVQPELRDQDIGSPQEIAAWLADLRLVNSWFGGVRTSQRLLESVADAQLNRSLSLLDVAAGSGDLPMELQRQMLHKGVRLEVTLLDRLFSHLTALQNPKRSRSHSHTARAVVGNALSLPFRDNSFDVVTCNLFAHHLEPAALKDFANEALRVSRTAVLINDLRRSVVSLWLVYAAFPLFRARMSWHDGISSVRRSYTIPEMHSILQSSDAGSLEITPHYLFRVGAILWKAAPQRTTSTSRMLSRPRKNLIEEKS